jgi:hypothetical protein
MGCDYYIHLYLEIEHISGIYIHELSLIRGYYCELDCGIYDSDDEEKNQYYHSSEYETLYENMKKLCLTPREPKVIYENHLFKTLHLEKKYRPILQQIMSKIDGEIKSLKDIIKITKKEKRYDPFDLS